jgi:DNA-binding NtrC family response regulator
MGGRFFPAASIGGRVSDQEPSDHALLLGASPARGRLVESLLRVARTPRTTVLVRGERGAGKRTAAELVHAFSDRRGGPCLALRAETLAPASLLQALDRARGGTLILLAVERLQDGAQAGLQAALADPALDVRVAVTTAEDLAADPWRGRLRADLLYRINVLSFAVPPLRERAEDLPLLARALCSSLARAAGSPSELEPEALAALEGQTFPGNLRELHGMLLAALARAGGGPIRRVHLDPLGEPGRVPAEDSDLTLQAGETRLIRRALALTRGNRSQAARVLGINRQTLYNKLAALGLERGAGVA